MGIIKRSRFLFHSFASFIIMSVVYTNRKFKNEYCWCSFFSFLLQIQSRQNKILIIIDKTKKQNWKQTNKQTENSDRKCFIFNVLFTYVYSPLSCNALHKTICFILIVNSWSMLLSVRTHSGIFNDPHQH